MRNLPENLRRKIVSFERLLLLFETSLPCSLPR